ncbi:MAG: hypothetical protein ABIO68_06100 [Sphingomicrobium sp.]
MKTRTVARIEFAVAAVAAAAMAAALGYAITTVVTGHYPYPVVPGMAAAAIAFTGIREVLKRLAAPIAGQGRQRPATAFALKLSDFIDVGAPVGLAVGPGAVEQPFVIDDVRAQPAADPRVVQLFGRNGQPATEKVKDDSEALFDALGKLRGTLR